MTALDFTLAKLDRRVVERPVSHFAEDLTTSSAELAEMIGGSRILIIGGAGSIGSSTLHTIVHFRPAMIHVIDHDENGLAELMRGLRAAANLPALPEMLTLPFDYGGDPFRLWFAANATQYDYVLNFAALKHVRSEKDPFSVLAMLETNVVYLDRLSRRFAGRNGLKRVFSVSTDKAANPSSMMGATKRLMEHALFSPTVAWLDNTIVSSARFANVAFSNGSLLQGWQFRLDAGQPLACPEDCRRFFVSLGESGHLCTLAGFLGADRTLTVPALDPAEHLVLLSDVATRFLEHHGYKAHVTHDPDEAVGRVAELRATGSWPLLLTPLDTPGEKPYEEFVGEHESLMAPRFSGIREVGHLAPEVEGSYQHLIERLERLLSGDDSADVTADGIKALIASVEPSFARTHRVSDKSLDHRI